MAAIRVSYAALSLSAYRGNPCEFHDKLGDILRKTKVSFVIVAQLGPTEILLNLSFYYLKFLFFLETNLRF